MGDAPEKNICLGLLAHVDAGKTTLSEAMLYLSGTIRTQGRVDHGSTLLDNFRIEKDRGITVFSKQASFSYGNTAFWLVDTPGHTDFACETERTLSVLDCAVMVISGLDGVQSHTVTLFRLLRRYHIPCFVFVSKMDLSAYTAGQLLADLKKNLSDTVCDFTSAGGIDVQVAEQDEDALDEYLLEGSLGPDTVSRLVMEGKVIPCVFGSGLKLDGVERLMSVLDECTRMPEYPSQPSAVVYKIGRDDRNERLTYAKITGGEYRVRQTVRTVPAAGAGEEKITGIRFYSGARYRSGERALPGQLCCFTGLESSFAGCGLDSAGETAPPVLEPVMTYRMLFPDGENPMQVYPKLRRLSEEDPGLHMEWNERLGEISVRLMGKIQTEVLTELIRDRFGISVQFDSGRVIYKETIRGIVEGIGHYEPLRHYAEVHLLIEEAPRGSGVTIRSACSTDRLALNWQRLIMTNIAEKTHLGVLTGSPLTDVTITLAAGRAHEKHTEGGDFRQAVYRAVRQGLMKAESVLLEPWYSFELTVPEESMGRAFTDLRQMNADFSSENRADGFTVFTGCAPVLRMNGYMQDVLSYTRGRGRLLLSQGGYRECAGAEAVIAETGYSPERDVENTPDSVFCSHGAGMNVSWDRVEEYMHLESCLRPVKAAPADGIRASAARSIDDAELERIMEREFGPIKRPQYSAGQKIQALPADIPAAPAKRYVIVDGYNVIFCWDELRKLAEESLDAARVRLVNMLTEYAAFTSTELVLVFDGYRNPGSKGSKEEHGGIFVVYTAEGELADNYIEGMAAEIGRNYSVRVVSGDNLVQMGAFRSGVLRTSSREFESEVRETLASLRSAVAGTNEGAHRTRVSDAVPPGET